MSTLGFLSANSSVKFFMFLCDSVVVLTIAYITEVEHDSDDDELIAVSDPRKGGKPAGSYSR